MKLPDGPKTRRIVQMIQWIANPLGVMENSASRYGDTFTLRIGSFDLVFFSNPQAIEQIFTANQNQFDSGRANSIVSSLVGTQSLLVLDGDRHQQQRRLLTPPFHGDRMKSYGQLIGDITDQVISEWKFGEPFAARSQMQEISLRVILQAVFGLDQGGRCDRLKELVASVLDLTGSPLRASLLFFPFLQKDLGAWSPWGHFLRQRQEIDQLIYAEISDRRQQPDASRTDILSLLMSAQDENGEPMTDIQLRDELMTLLAAGHETTASALTWALYWIHHLPQVRDKLLAELDSVGDNPDLTAISRLPYLNAVCQETLRIYPIAMISAPRITNSPVQIMGYEFGENTMLAPCIYLTHHREDIYPEPNSFKPERFLERQYSQYEYLPFGGSNRRCIGAAFAMFEMKLVLARILSRVELAIASNHPVKPTRRGVTLAPSGGKWLVATGQRQKANIPVGV